MKSKGTAEIPFIETLVDGDVAFRQQGGGHADGPNWPAFPNFASCYLDAPRLPSARQQKEHWQGGAARISREWRDTSTELGRLTPVG